MKTRMFLYSALVSVLTATLGGFSTGVWAQTKTYYGEPEKLGKGEVRAYVTLDINGTPAAIGVALTAGALDGLPVQRNTTGRCFDLNGNGRIDPPRECEGDYEYALAFPENLPVRSQIPFQWVGVNWNPAGHAPPGVWDLPHFDFHFYMASRDAVRQIRLGPCGYFMHCDDYKRAISPVPAKYVHPDHVNVDAAVAAMGNHLIDSRSPEIFFKPPIRFTHTWIFGAYDARIIFYEPMITHEFLMSRPGLCAPIKQPQAWAQAGYYPTQYCIRYHAKPGEYTVALEGFVYRTAQ